MNYWEEITKKVAKNFGATVDNECRFFICPECDESIYEDDWKERDYLNTNKKIWYCPICKKALADRR